MKKKRNPSSMVHTPHEEKLWKLAKEYVKESRGYRSLMQIKGEKDWGLVVKIFLSALEKYDGRRIA